MSVTVAAAAVVASGAVLRPGWISITGDRVEALGPGRPPGPVDVDLPTATIVPGFVDIHVHGGGGGLFGQGRAAARRAIATHRAHGSTTMLASLVSAHPDPLLRQVAELADAVEAGELAGIHLEGPWLSPQRRGAHDPSALRPPDPDEVARVLAAGRGAVRVVTLAPELPGALETIKALAGVGVVVAVGHTEATYAQTRAAIDAGATLATHLFNAMAPIDHREPGPVVALAEAPEVVVELILDGIHVHPAIYRQVQTWVGPDRLALVTDAMAAAGAPDGDYQLGTVAVIVRDGIARVRDTGSLAGSTATTDLLFRRAHAFSAGSPEEKLLSAVRETSTVPAGVLGRSDLDLSVGASADLVVLDAELSLTRVMIRGGWAELDLPPRDASA